MIPGNRYRYNFLGFPAGEGEFVGVGGDETLASLGCPEGWWEFEVYDNSTKQTSHSVFVNPALIATILPQ